MTKAVARRKLTPKRQRFVKEYLIDRNATAAARRAGYSERTAYSIGCELLTFPEVASAITKAVNAQAKRLDLTADRIIQEIVRIGLADIRQVLEVREDGVRIKPSSEWPDGAAATVSEVSETKDGAIKLKLHSKSRALEMLGKHLGLFESDAVPMKDVEVLVKALAQATEAFVRDEDLPRLARIWKEVLRERG